MTRPIRGWFANPHYRRREYSSASLSSPCASLRIPRREEQEGEEEDDEEDMEKMRRTKRRE